MLPVENSLQTLNQLIDIESHLVQAKRIAQQLCNADF
jgi:hypothetical protein